MSITSSFTKSGEEPKFAVLEKKEYPLCLISYSLYWSMPLDGDVSRLGQVVFSAVKRSGKYPIVSSGGFEVFLRDPFIGFLWVLPFDPLPDDPIDDSNGKICSVVWTEEQGGGKLRGKIKATEKESRACR